MLITVMKEVDNRERIKKVRAVISTPLVRLIYKSFFISTTTTTTTKRRNRVITLPLFGVICGDYDLFSYNTLMIPCYDFMIQKDEPIVVLDSQLPSKSKKLSDRKLLSYIKPNIISKNFRKIKSTPELLAGFRAMTKINLEFIHIEKKFKVGVIYYKGQTNEFEIFSQRKLFNSLHYNSLKFRQFFSFVVVRSL
jgi:hypothetical protein